MQNEEVDSKPGSGGWFRSSTAVVLFSILLPPLGLYLLWLRRTTETGKKVFASLAIAGWAAAYVYLLFFSGLIINRQPDLASHYDRLEQQRAQQRESGEPASASSNSNSAETATANSSANSNAAVAAPPETASRATGNYWTSYRGRDRDGNYVETAVRTDWPGEGLRPVWKQPIGGGYASFAVAGGVAFTIEQRRDQEVASAYDVRTGRELWTRAWTAEFKESMGGDGPRATPTWDSGRVYALGAVGDFYCLDAKTGRPLWSKNILKDAGAGNLQWGVSASPLVVDDKVIVIPGGNAGCVVAYNKVTGAMVWKSLQDRAAYASPMLVTLAGKRQILAMTAGRAVGLNPTDGALLWEYPFNAYQGINAAQPIVVGQNRVFISAGYGKGAALVEVNDTGNGLVPRAVWDNNISMKNKFNSSVLHEGFIYGLDEGILTCIDAASGERKWKGGRYGYGQVTLASGHLIVTTDDGDVVLVKATPSAHSEVARFHAIEGKTWNCPAISGGLLLVRNQTEMACFDLSVT
jgi:outer membrane protein assembly factor BamB